MNTPEFIAEENGSIKSLADIFKRAFFKATLDDIGGMIIDLDDGYRMVVLVESNKKLIRFMAIEFIEESATHEQKLELVNRMNDRVVFSCFSIPSTQPPDQIILVGDYYLPYEEGILPYQLVNAFKTFTKTVIGAIKACDQDRIIK